jgi:hypothetical protein
MSFRITFDSSARDFILGAFGKATHNGFIVQRSHPQQKVLTPRGEDIPVDEFAGVRKGSKVFVKSDIVSLVETARTISASEKAGRQA